MSLKTLIYLNPQHPEDDDPSMHFAALMAWPGSSPTGAMECIKLLGNDMLPPVRTELSE
jgi:hypothetical protein